MFAGFDPTQPERSWFERRRALALVLALLVHAAVGGLVVWLELSRTDENVVDVALDEPDVENLEIEEEPEEEPEPEPEPEPERPRPRPRQEIRNVTEQTKDVSESDVAPERAPEPEEERAPERVEKAPKVEEQPKVVKKRSDDVGDRETPRAFPADATPPRPARSNAAPEYPEVLRKENITGQIRIKLNIHMDGTVRGMKVLKKDVSGTDDPALQEKAQGLFLRAVVAAVKTWAFEPAKLKGKTISVWWPVTIPFDLN
jgi:TonB family protein